MSSLNSDINRHRPDPASFRKSLLQWYRDNKRQLPWRYDQGISADPYKIWLSEIMLQQTTVTAVIPYFKKFTKKWKTVHDLANASQEDVMDAWAGLGYYSRARNLHKCAGQIHRELNGQFPDNETELLKLAGVGPYTAAAITSIVHNKPANIIDGNVERVMARIFMLKKPLKDIKPRIKEFAATFIGDHEGEHSDYAQSLMELGALICTPKNPKCDACPVINACKSHKHNLQNTIPVAPPKKVKPKRFGYAYIIKSSQDELLIERRGDKGLLANTIGLPTNIWREDKKDLEHISLYKKENFKKLNQNINHVFTHFDLELYIYEAQKLKTNASNRYYWIKTEKIKSKLPTVFKKVYDLINAK
ncbi:MAG: A/G-specific adenine glycosylase [Alphaproteobacteria bacterium]|nr:A/G-specific adenine glycosylase [Alphaproteobacteria bacterium]